MTYCDDKEPFLRQAAVYGIGEFAVNTTKDFNLSANEMFEGIDKALRCNSNGQAPAQWATAKDNAISTLGKIIKHQYNHVNVSELMKKWVEYLPLSEDEIEAKKQHKLFVEMLLNNVYLVIGRNKKSLHKVIRNLCKITDTKYVDNGVIPRLKSSFKV